MTDRDLDDRDWMEDEARFEAEDEADWKEAERRSAAETAWAVSRCPTEGCEGEATERLGDAYLCPTCFEAAFQRAYDRERGMGR